MNFNLPGNAATILKRAADQGMPWRAPIDVDGIAIMLGANVVYDPTLNHKNIIGQISFLSSGALISLNPFENSYEPRRRFTLAHELGHLCLHSNDRGGFTDSRQTMSRTESYWDRFEYEANNFAAELLMPTELILEEYKSLQKIGRTDRATLTNELAIKFNVSSQAMAYRLNNLNLP